MLACDSVGIQSLKSAFSAQVMALCVFILSLCVFRASSVLP